MRLGQKVFDFLANPNLAYVPILFLTAKTKDEDKITGFKTDVETRSIQEARSDKPGDQQKHQRCSHLADHKKIARAEAAIPA